MKARIFAAAASISAVLAVLGGTVLSK